MRKLFLAFFFVACSMKNVAINDNRIQIDKNINFLNFKDLNLKNDSLLKFQAIFENNSDFVKDIVYKIIWLDEDNFEAQSMLSRWVLVKINSGRNLLIQGVAPNTRIKNFKLLIKKPTKYDKSIKGSYNNEFSN